MKWNASWNRFDLVALFSFELIVIYKTLGLVPANWLVLSPRVKQECGNPFSLDP